MPKDQEVKEHVVQRLKSLDNEFSEHKAYYKEIRQFIYPDGGWFPEDGEKPNTKLKKHASIVDDTGTRACSVMGSGMQSGLTSPARPWLKLGLMDKERDRKDKNRWWLNYATQTMLNLLAQTNFYSTIHSYWEETGAFNTAVLVGDRDDEEILSFNALTAGEYRIAANHRHKRPNVLYRRDTFPAQALVKEFGEENVSDTVKNLATPGRHGDPFKQISVVQAIEPREDRDPTKIDNLNMPWRSVWWEEASGSDHESLLRHSGYIQKNFFVSRWKVAGRSPYGTGPGKQALGNVKMLQEMQKSKIVALHKEISPPMVAPSGLKGRISLMPNTINWANRADVEGVGPMYQIAMNIQNIEIAIANVQQAIERTFMNDLFLLITERPQMTATEVAERHEEKLLLLGPTIERQIHDVLDPLVDWVFFHMVALDMLPPPPPDLEGQPMKVEYISLLAQAQKLVTGKAIESTLGLVERVSALDPQARFNINFDNAIREYAYITGFPPEAIRDQDETDELRSGELQQAAQQAQLEQAGAQADIAQTMGNTPIGEQTALNALVNEFEGGITGAG